MSMRHMLYHEIRKDLVIKGKKYRVEGDIMARFRIDIEKDDNGELRPVVSLMEFGDDLQLREKTKKRS